MATQGYGTAPSRNLNVNAGTSKPRSETTKPVPIIQSAMKTAALKKAGVKTAKGRSK